MYEVISYVGVGLRSDAISQNLDGRPAMIARIWHGYTKPENADAYEAISKVKGYRGSYFLRRDQGSEVEFVTILLWESLEELRNLAGPDYEVAVIPPERRKVLSHFDARACHYEVILGRPGI
jgi:heme-degrading monooxygenase HmoA